jgi:hypothetical protein
MALVSLHRYAGQHDTTPKTVENARAIFGLKQRRQFCLECLVF